MLVAGSANLDFIVRAGHVPAPGETVLGRDFATFAGGKGANQAIACARAGGAPTRMLLALGDDASAMSLESGLRAAGVSLAQGDAAAVDNEAAIAITSQSEAEILLFDLPPAANYFNA